LQRQCEKTFNGLKILKVFSFHILFLPYSFPKFSPQKLSRMFIGLFSGIVMGFLVSMPPLGPVTLAVLSKGLEEKHHDGLSIGLGAAIVDTFYALVALGGISLIITILPASITAYYDTHEQNISVILTYIGGIFVFLYGIKLLQSKQYEPPQKQSEKIHSRAERAQRFLEETTKKVGKFSFFSIFTAWKENGSKQIIMGAALAFSSITLPASWLAIASVLKSHRFIERTYESNAFFCVGVFIGTYLWFFTLLKGIAINKHRIGNAAIVRILRFAGMILIVLGIVLFYHAYQSPFPLL